MALRWGRVFLTMIKVHGEVIQIRICDVFDVMENIGHNPLECGTNIFKAERHLPVSESAPWAYEGCLQLI